MSRRWRRSASAGAPGSAATRAFSTASFCRAACSDVEWLSESGEPLDAAEWEQPDRHRLVMVLASPDGGRIAILVNGDRRAGVFVVPARPGLRWSRRRRHRARHRQAPRRRRAVDRRALGGLSQRGSGAAGMSGRQATIGGAAASSTRSIRARSRTAPATAPAISLASSRGCRMSPRSASMRSGCRPSSSRRWPIWATTSPTIARSIRCSDRSRISTGWSPRRTGSASR